MCSSDLGLFVGLASLTIDIGQAAELTNIGTLAAFMIVCAGVMFLRKQKPDVVRPFMCPLVPLVPIAGIISCLVLMLSLPIVTWIRFFVWMGLGVAVYIAWGLWRTKKGEL